MKFSNSRLSRRWRGLGNRPFSVHPDQRKSNYKGDQARKWMRTDVFNELRTTKASHSFSCYRAMCSVRSGGRRDAVIRGVSIHAIQVRVRNPYLAAGGFVHRDDQTKTACRDGKRHRHRQAQRQGTVLYSGEKWPHLRHLLYHSRIKNSTSEFTASAPFLAPLQTKSGSKTGREYD